MEKAEAHLQHLELELKLCESDERALDRLLSQGSTESERMPPERTSSPPRDGGEGGVMSPSPSVRQGVGSKSGSATADVDEATQIPICLDVDDTGAGVDRGGRGETKKGSSWSASTEAMRSERLARARGRLNAEKARREAALAQTEAQLEAASAAARARLEAAAAQLIEAEAEAAAAVQEEKEAADASASAWSQVHMERVRSASPRGTAAQRAEEETGAARERAQEEARLQQARAKLKGAQERLRQTERELTLCKGEEVALREAEERAFRALDGTDPNRLLTDPQPTCQLRPSSVTSEEIVLELGISRGEIGSPDEPEPEVDPVLRLQMEGRSHLEAKASKEAKRQERLRRARGRLGAERGRREKAEAEATARMGAMARGGVSELGWSPLALRSPSEIINGLGPVQRRESPIDNPRSRPRLTSSQSTSSPLRPPPMVRKDGDVWGAGGAQAALPETIVTTSPSALAAQRWLADAMQDPPHNKPRSRLSSIGGSIGASRRRVAVVPSFVSCTHEPPDRQGLVASRILPADETLGIRDSSLAAQRWLSTTIEQLSSRRESEVGKDREDQEEDGEDDDRTQITES